MSTRKRTAAIRILEILEEVCADKEPSVAEISSRLDIPSPTVYRNIESLLEAGFLSRDPTGRLCPGLRTRSILFSSLFREPMVSRRRCVLEHLSTTIQETVSISVPYGNSLIYFDRVESHWPVRFSLNVGDRLPIAGSASGKLYLSNMKEAHALAIFRESLGQPQARNTIRDEAKFQAELARIREQGYATDNEEFFTGMIGAAVPVPNAHGEIGAFLSTHCLTTRKSLAQVVGEIPLMLETANLLRAIYADNDDAGSAKLTAAE